MNKKKSKEKIDGILTFFPFSNLTDSNQQPAMICQTPATVSTSLELIPSTQPVKGGAEI